MRWPVLILCAFALAGGAWFLFRDDGVIEKVTAERIEQALLDNRVPPKLAACMAPELADRLSITQLLKLERAKPQAGESTLPLSTGEAMARLRRIADRQAVEQVVIVAGKCSFGVLRKGT